MKNILIACLLLQYTATAQTLTRVVYDKQADNFTTPIPAQMKEGDMISISYSNINPFAYAAHTTFSTVNHSYDDGLDVLQSLMPQVTGSNAAESEKKEKLTQALTSERAGTKEHQRLSEEETSSEKRESAFAQIQNDFTTIIDNVENINGIMSIDALLQKAEADINNDSPAKMQAMVLAPLRPYGIATAGDVTIVFTQQLTSIRNALNDVVKQVSVLQTLHNDLSDEEKEVYQAQEDSILEKVRELNKTYSGDNLALMQKNVNLISAEFIRINNTPFTLPAKQIGTADGDFIVLSDTLMANNVAQLIIPPHKIRTHGGSRIDFSVGLAATIGGNGRDYGLISTSDTGKVTLTSSQKNKLFVFNPAVFVHWYNTTKGAVQVALTTGLAPDVTTLANSKLYIGGSLGFISTSNLSRRMLISAGVALGYADLLQQKYKGYDNYRQFGNLDVKDMTEKVLRVGGFLAVTYNLGGIGH